MKRIHWGILSTANIASKAVIPALQQSEYGAVTAIASRSLEKAQAVAQQLHISKAYGSYEELLADPDIDAIYNPLPNHMHVPWSITALEAGKHVLCEKPISLTPEEGQKLLEAAQQHPDLKIMEAFMYRFHPQWQLTKKLVTEGKIGALRTIHTSFSYFLDDPENIRNKADVGGGALLDIGCYPISLARFIFGTEPKRVLGIMEYDPTFQTDRLVSGILEFDQGTSTFTCGTLLSPYQRVTIFGTTGRIEIEIPFNAPSDRPCRIWHTSGIETEEILLDVCDQYTLQGDQFALAILNNTATPVPIEDALANINIIEAITQSARSGTWI